MDLSHEERGIAARAMAKTKRDDEIRRVSDRLIGNVLANTKGKPEIDILAAIGAVCPFDRYDRRGRELWIETFHRLRGEE